MPVAALAWHVLALVGLWVADPQDPAAAPHTVEGGVFMIDLPPDWRQLTPNEALELRGKLPALVDVAHGPDAPRVFGNVDSWLATGDFDGRALVVHAAQHEFPATDAALRELAEARDEAQIAGGRRTQVVSAERVELGASEHPALELVVRVIGPDGAPELMLLDWYASTMRQRLVFQFVATAAEWSAAEPVFRSIARTLRFARPPEATDDRGSAFLGYALFGGALVLVLLVARRLVRRPPGHTPPPT